MRLFQHHLLFILVPTGSHAEMSGRSGRLEIGIMLNGRSCLSFNHSAWGVKREISVDGKPYSPAMVRTLFGWYQFETHLSGTGKKKVRRLYFFVHHYITGPDITIIQGRWSFFDSVSGQFNEFDRQQSRSFRAALNTDMCIEGGRGGYWSRFTKKKWGEKGNSPRKSQTQISRSPRPSHPRPPNPPLLMD